MHDPRHIDLDERGDMRRGLHRSHHMVGDQLPDPVHLNDLVIPPGTNTGWGAGAGVAAGFAGAAGGIAPVDFFRSM